MDVDRFWALVGASRAGLDLTDPEAAVEQQVETLRGLLGDLPDRELLGFQERLHEQARHANDWRIWAAGYLAAGGMGDDAFDYFRLWLVLQGRTVFDQVLAAPDALAGLRWDPDGEAFDAAEPLGYLVAELLEDRGSDPGDSLVAPTATGEPTGRPFPEDDDRWFASTFPQLQARVDDQAERVTRYSGDDSAEASRWLTDTRLAQSPLTPARMEPLLAAELYDRGFIRPQDRPMLAAFWLADDLGADAVLALASLRGHEPEVSELWPEALRELGVVLPVGDARVAMPWAARHVVAGERDVRWLVRVLWTSFDEVDTQDEFQRLVLTIDDWLDWTDRDLRSRHPASRARADSARRALHAAVESMVRDDVAGALRVLGEWTGE